jgi:hypothetical protein
MLQVRLYLVLVAGVLLGFSDDLLKSDPIVVAIFGRVDRDRSVRFAVYAVKWLSLAQNFEIAHWWSLLVRGHRTDTKIETDDISF